MATKDDSEIPESGAVFTFGKSKFADNLPNKFWVKNDKVLQIACGDEHTALITESGRVFMFGPNDWGQLGLGSDTKVANKPSCIKSLKHDKSRLVACGRSHTLVTTASGHVYSFGSNSESQLGIKDVSDLSTPKKVETLPEEEIKMVDAGSDSSVALTEDGRVYVWGGNEDGKLGLGTVENAEEPILLAMERPAVCIACGYYHTAIVLDDGRLFMMGESEGGKLGLPEEVEPTNTPQQVTDISEPVKWVACGSSHTVALTESGEVFVFGEGESGQLGLGTETLSCQRPTLLKLPFKVSRVFCGQAFTALISEKGQLYTFGDGRHGKLAHGSDVFSNQFKPFHSKRFSKFLVDKVACGGCHMIVTARPKALNGVEEDDNEDVDEMKIDNKSISQPRESAGSPSLTRTLSARERRRDEVSRSFSSLNQTLPPLGQSRILPSLSATMPALKSPAKDDKEETLENGFVPRLQNGKTSDVDSARDTEEEEDSSQKRKKRTKLPHPIASPRRSPQQNQEMLKPQLSPLRMKTPRSKTKADSLPPIQDGKEKEHKTHGSGSEGDMENDDEEKDEEKKKRKKGKKRKPSKTEEDKSQPDEKEEDSWNDDDDEDDSEREKEVKRGEVNSLRLDLPKRDSGRSGEDDDNSDDEDKYDKEEEKGKDSLVSQEDKEKESDSEIKEARGPVPVPRKHKQEESEDNDEEEVREKDTKTEVEEEKENEKDKEGSKGEDEDEKEEVKVSDQEDEKDGKKDKKDKKDKKKDKKKKKEDKDEEEEDDKKEDDKEEDDEKEDSKSKGKDKKKDKKKDKEKDKKKKKGKDEEDEDEGDKEEDEEDEEKSDKKSKDKKKDKKDKKKDKKDKDKKKDEEEEENKDEEDKDEEDEKDGKKKKKDKDKKEKDKKKKKGKEEDDDKDVNGNNEKTTQKKSRTCTIL